MDELILNSSSLRPIEELDKECSSIWKDWIPSTDIEISNHQAITIHQTGNINDQKDKLKSPSLQKDIEEFSQIVKNQIQSPTMTKERMKEIELNNKKRIEFHRRMEELKVEKRTKIIWLSKQIKHYKEENQRLERELSELQAKLEKSKNNIPLLQQKINHSYFIKSILEEKHEHERKSSVFAHILEGT